MKNKTALIAMSALMAALITVATIVIPIPTLTGGYVNLGDGFVIVSALTLGPVWGTLAAAVGSSLSDLFLGYAIYAPATFVIKGLMALAAYYVSKILFRAFHGRRVISLVVASLTAEVIMVLSYFVFEYTVMRYGIGAAAGILPNCLQGAFGIVSASVLYLLLEKAGIRKIIPTKGEFNHNDREH